MPKTKRKLWFTKAELDAMTDDQVAAMTEEQWQHVSNRNSKFFDRYLRVRWERMNEAQREEQMLAMVAPLLDRCPNVEEFWKLWEQCTGGMRYNLISAVKFHGERWPKLAAELKAWMLEHYTPQGGSHGKA